MTELPSLTRNPYDFVGVSSGATQASVRRGIGFALNGQRAESGGFLLDGSANNDPYNSGPSQIVPLDAVQEYRLLTNNFTAEYGRNAGFIANAITKSGVNEFHGNAYYFLRHSGLAANTFENNSRGLPRPVFNRRQLGGTLGGPVYRDKVFFFAAYRAHPGTEFRPSQLLCPNPATALGQFTRNQCHLRPLSLAHQPLRHRYQHPDRLSLRKSLRVQVRCRLCHVAGIGFDLSHRAGGCRRRSAPGHLPLDGAGRHQHRSPHGAEHPLRLSGPCAAGNRRSALFPLLDRSFHLRNQTMTVNLTRFWSGNFLTESRLVFNRLFRRRAIQLPGGFPSFVITGDEISGAVGSLALPSGRNGDGGAQNEYQFQQMANWVRGRHNLKFGASLVHLRDNQTPAESVLTRHNHVEFKDLQRFVNGRASSFQIHLDPRGKVPGELLAPPFGPFNPQAALSIQ